MKFPRTRAGVCAKLAPRDKIFFPLRAAKNQKFLFFTREQKTPNRNSIFNMPRPRPKTNVFPQRPRPNFNFPPAREKINFPPRGQKSKMFELTPTRARQKNISPPRATRGQHFVFFESGGCKKSNPAKRGPKFAQSWPRAKNQKFAPRARGKKSFY